MSAKKGNKYSLKWSYASCSQLFLLTYPPRLATTPWLVTNNGCFNTPQVEDKHCCWRQIWSHEREGQECSRPFVSRRLGRPSPRGRLRRHCPAPRPEPPHAPLTQPPRLRPFHAGRRALCGTRRKRTYGGDGGTGNSSGLGEIGAFPLHYIHDFSFFAAWCLGGGGDVGERETKRRQSRGVRQLRGKKNAIFRPLG